MGSRLGVLDWNALRDILAVADAGSLSGAARRLGVSQSTMSRRIAALAAEGLHPFAIRDDGRLDLTPTGEILLEAARGMQQSFERVSEQLQATQPTLRVAACETTSRLFMGPLLRAWAQAGGGAVELAVLEDMFQPGDSYDLLLRPASGDAPEGGVRAGRLTWGLFASPDYLAEHPVSDPVTTLAGHRVIQASGSLARFGAYKDLDALGGEIGVMTSSPLAQLEAAALGQGIALLPVELVGSDAHLQRITGFAAPPMEVALSGTAQRASMPRVARFLRFARRHFGGATMRPAQA